MPSRRASAMIFSSSPGSNASPCLRRTGVSIEMADTRETTRPLFVWSSTRLHIVGRERGPTARQRDERQVAERLGAVALVLIEVAFFLHDDPARAAGKRAHGQVIGERAGRQEDRAAPCPECERTAARAVRRRRRGCRSLARWLFSSASRASNREYCAGVRPRPSPLNLTTPSSGSGAAPVPSR